MIANFLKVPEGIMAMKNELKVAVDLFEVSLLVFLLSPGTHASLQLDASIDVQQNVAETLKLITSLHNKGETV